MKKTYGFLVVATLVSGLTYGQNGTNLVIRTPVTATPGLYNTLLGIGTGLSITTNGDDNTVVGYQAGNKLTSGYDNTYVGYQAGFSNNTGLSNTFLGHSSGYSNLTGSSNVFIGKEAGKSNTQGTTNVFVGAGAGSDNKSGNNNVFLGMNTGVTNETGDNNTFLGRAAGYYNLSASNNIAVGYQAGYNMSTGGNNIMIGVQAGNKTSLGTNNVFAGYQAGFNNISGGSNLFLGAYAGASSNGSYNLFIGNSSGQLTTSGAGNTFIGNGSGYANGTGSNNTYIGNGAGFTGNAAGQSNTFIGQNAGVSSGAVVNNATAIGAGAQVSADNSIVLGAPSPIWKVGIGNTAPNNKLEITHGTNGQSGLRFTNLKSTDAASLTNQTKVLSVNSSGDVILVSTNGSTREGVADSFWQRKGSFLQSTQNDAVIIGNNVARTPSGYKLFVEEGILTEKVKVAIKNSSEWSDYVFDDTYQLKGLSEVERYVKANRHLPGVPSATDVVKQGIDVAKMDATLLAKIEELTLYSIKLEKDNREQKAINQQQQAQLDELKQLVRQLLEKK
ncbi:hypothetical protein IC229_27980 [Spirosoma sp. BT702]|uniref:TMF family protein n=1 Tax=Spirosoma profusum TaxID=2771354 RepID=A0A926Y129_9BACT|nr:hypothetical protein [Spirosoma profusum]MBD2704512.1 hypothetical protein [Spirosoma profusum]